MSNFNFLLRDDSAVTAIEYALIALFIAVVIVGAVTAIGTSLVGIFNQVKNSI